ncbi:MAG: FAD-dependent monooxygenase [Comamonas sp.]
MSKPILIAGAGIGGLTAALALLQRGHQVLVLEQAAVLGEVGAGLQLSANATRALELLGLKEPLHNIAAEPSGKEIRLWNSGRTWKLFDFGEQSIARWGSPYYMAYRPDLHRILYEAVLQQSPECVRLNTKITRFEQDGADSVWVEDTQGQRYEGRALIGADGVHSPIRQQLFGDSKPEKSGCIAWRGVIPIEQLPAGFQRPVGTNWVGPGRHVIHYPLRGGKLLNFVGIVEKDIDIAESWTQIGTHEECHDDFAGWHADVHTMIEHIERPFKWTLLARPPLTTWSQGLVTLLGDAAHPTLPFLAQGAAMAIEDGYVIAQALHKFADVSEALRQFEQARVARTNEIVSKSTENGRRFHNPELANEQGANAYVDREWSEDKVLARYDWLFRYRVDEVFA